MLEASGIFMRMVDQRVPTAYVPSSPLRKRSFMGVKKSRLPARAVILIRCERIIGVVSRTAHLSPHSEECGGGHWTAPRNSFRRIWWRAWVSHRCRERGLHKS